MSAPLLAGRAVLVTGSSRGIGAAIARACAREGARVAITFRESEGAACELAAELGGTLCTRLDVTRRASVRRALDAVLERWGRLDILVNNAGTLEQKPFLEITEDEWDATLAVNLRGAFLCIQEAARAFERQGSGAIVNVASVGGQLGGPKAPHYSASKAGLISLTRSTARLFAPSGVRVNAVSPGFIRTDMYEHITAGAAGDAITAAIPLGRVGEPEDVAEAVVFLASDRAAFVTGEVLNVNGGQYMG